MSVIAKALTRSAWEALGGNRSAVDSLVFVGSGGLPSTYPVTDFASAAIATAALSLLELLETCKAKPQSATVDRRLASLWFGMSIRPDGWKLPAPWDPIAGDYQTSDGWIRLHTNAPHHRAAAERVLGSHPDRESMARAVAGRRKGELETAIVEAGGCAAEMRTAAEWAEHPQGRALAAEPLAHIATGENGQPPAWQIPAARPLQGLKVLDLTRVLAGPVATRFLAGYGAEVLRIDPPGWDEPAIVPEVTLGKRCARLDLRRANDRKVFEQLLSKADILLHGYRAGALDGLGYDPARRRALSPGLVDVCLDAYGWSGPWSQRRGFDSLVQMSAGIAEAGMRWRAADKPVPLPVQALDHATGYLMAATAIRGVTRRLIRGNGMEARLSLARTAKLLVEAGAGHTAEALAPETSADSSSTIENTDWGAAQRLNPPIMIAGTPIRWDYPASKLGSAEPGWR
ncbi:MAG TPA: CoA transferase [Candidatus Binataceae bacterium]|nr:CoA transferase [Candidatus Binataceae bacterium]